jgi:ABC-type phosphate/phosphonate transport system substrate-binding protein
MSETPPTGFAILRAQHLFGYQTRFRALCTDFGEAIGVDLEPFTARGYGELTEAFEKGSLGLAWVPPVTAARLVRRQIVAPLALPRRGGKASYTSVLIAHEDASSAIADYPNPRVAWVDQESAAGYLAARGPMLAGGIAGFASERFFGSHGAVVDAVAIRAADLGATFATFDDATGELLDAEWLDEGRRKLRPVKIVARFGTIPNDCIVVSARWSKVLQERARAWLFDAPPERLGILASLLRTDRFEPVDEAWHGGIERVLAEARAHGMPELGARRSPDVRRGRT